MSSMSYSAFKRSISIGTEIRIRNLRRPWRSRVVKVSARTSKRIGFSDGTFVAWPAASGTSMNGKVCTILSAKDGPRFNADASVDTKHPLLAGMPLFELEVVS